MLAQETKTEANDNQKTVENKEINKVNSSKYINTLVQLVFTTAFRGFSNNRGGSG